MTSLLAFEFQEASWIGPVCMIIAWFVQMGLHEGGHAYVATWLGDPVPRMFGRVTINPFRHIEWRDFGSIFGAVLLPIATAFSGWIPMGMASVPISRHNTADDAKISLAGPLGSFAGALIGVILAFALWPVVQSGALGNLGGTFVVMLGYSLVVTSALYGAFNLLPIPPLDGSSIAYHYMNSDGRIIMDKIRPYGFFIIIAVFWLLPAVSGGKLNAGDIIFDPIMEWGLKLTIFLPEQIYGPLM